MSTTTTTPVTAHDVEPRSLREVWVGTPAERRARLQGWRGDDLRAAVEAGVIGRLAPLACGIGAMAAAVTGSRLLVAVVLATAISGIVGRNHVVEAVANAIAGRRGGPQLPPNRAAKRLGCAIGSAHLVGAMVALGAGATSTADLLLYSLGGLALFVAASGICIPSIVYTLALGPRRATAAHLFGRAR